LEYESISARNEINMRIEETRATEEEKEKRRKELKKKIARRDGEIHIREDEITDVFEIVLDVLERSHKRCTRKTRRKITSSIPPELAESKT